PPAGRPLSRSLPLPAKGGTLTMPIRKIPLSEHPAIARRYAGGETLRELARSYRCCFGSIWNVLVRTRTPRRPVGRAGLAGLGLTGAVRALLRERGLADSDLLIRVSIDGPDGTTEF